MKGRRQEGGSAEEILQSSQGLEKRSPLPSGWPVKALQNEFVPTRCIFLGESQFALQLVGYILCVSALF